MTKLTRGGIGIPAPITTALLLFNLAYPGALHFHSRCVRLAADLRLGLAKRRLLDPHTPICQRPQMKPPVFITKLRAVDKPDGGRFSASDFLRRLLGHFPFPSKNLVPAVAAAHPTIVVDHDLPQPGRIPVVLSPEMAVVMALREVVPGYSGPISPETALGAEGVGLDSISFFELVLAVERLAGTVLRKDDLDVAALATIGSLADLVDRMRRR